MPKKSTGIDLKQFFLPNVDADVQENMDRERIRSIHRLSFAGMVFMVLTLYETAKPAGA